MELSPCKVSQSVWVTYRHHESSWMKHNCTNVYFILGYSGGFASAGLGLGARYGHGGTKGPKQGMNIFTNFGIFYVCSLNLWNHLVMLKFQVMLVQLVNLMDKVQSPTVNV